jgi:YD repeat-containing protein
MGAQKWRVFCDVILQHQSGVAEGHKQLGNAGKSDTRTYRIPTHTHAYYEYDAENKLVRLVSPSSTANYKYDGLGRRVEKEVIAGSTTTARYVYDNEDREQGQLSSKRRVDLTSC